MRLAVSLGDFWNEGPREALIGFCIGCGVTAALAKVGSIFHRKARVERRVHHSETMEAHRRTHETLGINPREEA